MHNFQEITKADQEMNAPVELDDSDFQQHDKQNIEVERQQAGSVNSSVYLSFIKSSGGVFSLVSLAALFFLSQAAFSVSDLWISDW